MKLGVYHPGYLRDFYAERPQLEEESYQNQLEVLLEDYFGSSNFWTRELSRLGYQTCDTVSNSVGLQRRWASEHGRRWNSDDWLFDTTFAQIAEFRPDVLLVADYSTFTAEFLKRVRRDVPSVRLVAGWCGAPPGRSDVLKEWDVALSCVPELVASFRGDGLTSFHVNHAFEPRIVDIPDDQSSLSVDFSFLGSVVPRKGFHERRERLLIHLVERTGLMIWSDLDGDAGKSIIRRISGGVDRKLRSRAKRALFGRRMFSQLRRSRVTLNNHLDTSANSASNMRLFEATGMGACLVTDAKDNLATLFEPDLEVATYSSPEECAEKVAWLLANEGARREMAAAGQRRTLRDHTFASRAEAIDGIIRHVIARQ